MPSLVANSAFDMVDLIASGSLAEFFEWGDVELATQSEFIVGYADEEMSERLDLTGTFQDYSADGYPTSGTVTGASYTLNGVTMFTITEMSISVEAFTNYVLSDDLDGLFSTILAGDDTLRGSGADDSLVGYAGNDEIGGGSGDDQLFGDDGADLLSEFSGDSGPFGNDTYNGGAGNDRVSYFTSDGFHGVTVDLNITGPQNTGNQGTDTLISIENVTATYDNDTLIGNAADNWFWTFSGTDTVSGNAGNDYFTLGAGDKVVSGGTGVDTAEIADFSYAQVYQNAGGVRVSLELQGSAQWVGTGYWTLTGIENLGGFSEDDSLTGDGGANVLAGSIGDDVLSGHGGNDSLYGDGVFVTNANGVQQLVGDNVVDGPGGNDILEGGNGNDLLSGGRGNDMLTGGAGADMVDGGAGNDTASYADASGGVSVDLRVGSAQDTVNAGLDTLASIENLEGSNFGDSLTGDDAANTLSGAGGADRLMGYGGNDMLTGGSGDDVMRGGAGDDTYFADSGDDLAVELAGEGRDTVYASVNYRLRDNVEDLTLTGSAVRGYGNDAANRIIGTDGANIIDGLAGADVMRGGLGNDTYYVDNDGDSVVEVSGQGDDTVYSSISINLDSNVESLVLTGSAIRGNGNSLDNRIIGTDGANVLNGGLGVDVVRGGLGNDLYYVETAGDRTIEAGDAGRDRVYSTISWTIENNIEDLFARGSDDIELTGNALTNLLRGNAGDNVLDGRGGADNLLGAAGADTFTFRDGELGGTTPSTADRIIDFSHSEGDRIDLTSVDANGALGGDQAFSFIGTEEFTGAAGQLRYEVINGNTYVTGDTNGDGVADLMVRLDGGHTLIGGDFIL